MRKSRYSEEQIIRVLQEVESGRPVKEVCREYGIANQTYYSWKAKYGGMDVNEARRLKELELENLSTEGLRQFGDSVQQPRLTVILCQDVLLCRRQQ